MKCNFCKLPATKEVVFSKSLISRLTWGKHIPRGVYPWCGKCDRMSKAAKGCHYQEGIDFRVKEIGVSK